MTDAIKSFSPIRMTAATEDAAVTQALQIVGAAREDVSVEVLSQDAKGVTVRVSPRKDDVAPITESSTQTSEPQIIEEQPNVYLSTNTPGEEVADAMDAVVPIEPEADLSATNDIDELKTVENLQDVLPTLPANQPVVSSVAEIAVAENSDEEVVEADEQSKERAQALAQEILNRMGMEAEAKLISAPAGSGRSDVPRIYLQIDGEDVGILIGKHGQTLQSFQYLLNVSLNNTGEEGEGNHFRVSVDAGGYRARRGDALQQMALDAAERAKRDRRSVRLEPMPAHERRLVHMALQNDGTISTSSEGREPLRHVVVIPAGARPSAGGGRPNGSFGGRDNAREGNRGGFGGRSREGNNRNGGYRGTR